MKKFLVSLMCAALVAASFVSCAKKESASAGSSEMRVAMVTDYGDITDQSFNQTTYRACDEFSKANGLAFQYYKPAGDSTEARVSSINAAIQDGYNVIVMPGYAFAEAIVKTVDDNDDVYFIGLDVSEYDLTSSAEAMGKEGWTLPANAFCAVYAEEVPGFMAGYAAVKEGYRHLGFLGGMAVPAVIRYGYGFVQGCNKAAEEMGISDSVSVEYIYGGQFFGDPQVTAAMDGWYQNRGVEVVFACGGGIFTSACEAAAKVSNGKVIGVDTDQTAQINAYGEGMCVTSAMKGLSATVKSVLASIKDGSWSTYSANILNLGLVSGTDVELNYVQLPLETWSMKNFTVEDYKTLTNDIYTGKVVVSNDIDSVPAHSIGLTVYANLK